MAATPKKQVLTDVVLETLSIIAYKQPVTKMEIEKIRGVKSDHAVNRLVEYNLVYEVGRLDAPGRPEMRAGAEEAAVTRQESEAGFTEASSADNNRNELQPKSADNQEDIQ